MAEQLATHDSQLKRRFFGTLTIAAGLALAACGDNGSRSPTTGNAPVAVDDTATMAPGQPVTVNVLDNDHDSDGDMLPGTVRFVDPPSKATLSVDGRTLTVQGEGSWTVDAQGAVTFTPVAGFAGTPKDVDYTVADARGNVSDPANIRINVRSTGTSVEATGASLADVLAGRWVPLGCGNLPVGGSDGSYRDYHLYVKTGANTLEMRGNRFIYSAAPCAGSWQIERPESDLHTTARLVVGTPESLNGHTVYRVQYSSLDPFGNASHTYQASYTFTPSGHTCLRSMTQDIPTNEIVEAAANPSSNTTNCGIWER